MRGQTALLAGLCLAAGYLAGRSGWPALPGKIALPAPVCRPSDPAAALAGSGAPVVLLFGNSLLFDHDWRLDGAAVVNCARQGLRAGAALETAGRLPDPAPTAILLGFGSVEALHTARGAAGDGLARDMAALAARLQARWPGVPLIALTVPLPDPGGPIAPEAAAAANAALAALPGLRLLDVNTLRDPGGPWLYDGVHLAPAVYGRLERALAGLLPAAR